MKHYCYCYCTSSYDPYLTEWVLRVGDVDGIGGDNTSSYRSDAPPGGGYIVREELLSTYIT